MATVIEHSVTVSADASGAYLAARAGQAVLVIDVIDMGTTLEAALQAGALAVLGASPVPCRAPVPLDPAAVGRYAARLARERRTEVVLIAEPRWGSDPERLARASGVLEGLRSAGCDPTAIYPNLGAETVKLLDFHNKVVVAVTDCGGTAFDAAFNQGVPVTTGTVARTYGHTGWENATACLRRALRLAEQAGRGLCIVASSGKAAEDVLAAHYLAQRVQQEGWEKFLGMVAT